ncbi:MULTISPECIES: hypothetical protein [Mammaliicoccus]|uniref:hypothetical protein n=1 Tax=Mammaliicoccus TaxID=2803850 RepID=UPI0007D8D0DE|nr:MULTISPECIES: hypothetical protein [Mammaliicoccus]OAO24457.1 hypothetical protein AXY34_04705 [Mammaliicoccus lentus]
MGSFIFTVLWFFISIAFLTMFIITIVRIVKKGNIKVPLISSIVLFLVGFACFVGIFVALPVSDDYTVSKNDTETIDKLNNDTNKDNDKKTLKDNDKNSKSDDDDKDTTKSKLLNTPKEEFTNLTGSNIKDIQRNPDDFKDKPFMFKGKIIQETEKIITDKYRIAKYRIAIDDDYDNVVLVELVDSDKSKNRLLENDYVTIEALYKGLETYESVSHTNITIPMFNTDKELVQLNNEQS